MTKSIVIIDDDADDVAFISSSLLRQGIEQEEIHCFKDGNELFNFLRMQKNDLPSLIITDLKMPRFNGKDLLTYIKENEDYCHLPVIIITTAVSDEQKTILYKLSATCVIIKPSSVEGYTHIASAIKTLWLSNGRML